MLAQLLAYSHKPDPSCSTVPIASSTHIQYAISAAMEMENVWLARLTCLANNQNSHNLARYQALKTMSGTVQKMQKQ